MNSHQQQSEPSGEQPVSGEARTTESLIVQQFDRLIDEPLRFSDLLRSAWECQHSVSAVTSAEELRWQFFAKRATEIERDLAQLWDFKTWVLGPVRRTLFRKYCGCVTHQEWCTYVGSQQLPWVFGTDAAALSEHLSHCPYCRLQVLFATVQTVGRNKGQTEQRLSLCHHFIKRYLASRVSDALFAVFAPDVWEAQIPQTFPPVLHHVSQLLTVRPEPGKEDSLVCLATVRTRVSKSSLLFLFVDFLERNSGFLFREQLIDHQELQSFRQTSPNLFEIRTTSENIPVPQTGRSLFRCLITSETNAPSTNPAIVSTEIYEWS